MVPELVALTLRLPSQLPQLIRPLTNAALSLGHVPVHRRPSCGACPWHKRRAPAAAMPLTAAEEPPAAPPGLCRSAGSAQGRASKSPIEARRGQETFPGEG